MTAMAMAIDGHKRKVLLCAAEFDGGVAELARGVRVGVLCGQNMGHIVV